ncbi:hypothetical protein KP509_11G094200 [Ceratopteris richardii]|nr:hypothetical protein KP509_11G094200 [Ceratopteris richardii]
MGSSDIDPCKLQGKNCMCHVCDCGTHKCSNLKPPTEVHYPKGLGSEYSGRYVQWPNQEKLKPKDSAAARDSPPFKGVTTNKADYCPKKFSQRIPALLGGDKALGSCMPGGSYTNVVSEYGHGYKKKPLQQRTPASTRAKAFAEGARFDDTTTNHSDFKAWPLAPRAPAHLPSPCFDDGSRLDDVTTYSRDFWDKSKALPPPIIPRRDVNTALHPPLSDETTHHHDFVAKPLPERFLPVRHDADHLRDPVERSFAGETTYHGDFKAWPTKLNHRIDPLKCHLTAPLDTPFGGETNYRHDYKAPKFPKRCPVLLRPRPQKFQADHFLYE